MPTKRPIRGACVFLEDMVPAPTNPPIAGASGPVKICTTGMIRQIKPTANAIDDAFNITSNDG